MGMHLYLYVHKCSCEHSNSTVIRSCDRAS